MAALSSRLTLLIGSSQRLRDDVLTRLREQWSGPVQRQIDPGDPATMLLGLETPSLFGDPPLLIVRTDDAWLHRHREVLTPHIGAPLVAGAMLLVVDAADGTKAITKAFTSANAVIRADGPSDARDLAGWVAMQISAHPQGVAELHRIVDVLVQRLGNDPDAILGAIDLIALGSYPGKLDPEIAQVLVVGEAEQPMWEFSNALMEGRAAEALRMVHAPEAPEPMQLLSGVLGELRRLIACHDTRDDGEASRQAGAKKSGAMYHARRKAARIKRSDLLRVMAGAVICLRSTRSGGRAGGDAALEQFVLQSRRVLGGA